jgi:hypothetical protein
MPETVGPLLARKTWRTLEPLHGMIYFAPEAAERYAALGIDNQRTGYFASRSAAMGAVPPETVIATFFNFEPVLVRRTLPAAWEATTPERLLTARLEAADAALRRALGETLSDPALAEAAGLARRAAEAACERPEGRPLFAAHAALPWPDDPHLVLWHAQTLLREFRGDAHVAALLLEGLRGIDALVTHAATREVPADVLRTTRGWSVDDWAAAVEDLATGGLVARASGDEVALTDAGRAQRARIEDRTDVLAVAAYAPLGPEGCERLRDLARPFSRAVVDAGLLGPGPEG